MIDVTPAELETVRRILLQHVPECEVRAFGSRARWIAKSYSDLDLVVLGEGILNLHRLNRLREAFEASTLRFRVDVVDWHATSPGFRRIIEQNYVVLQKENQDWSTEDEWKLCRWGDLATLEYGKGLSGYENGVGQYPVYGTNGKIGMHTEPLWKGAGVIIGRKGAYRGVHYSDRPFYVIDTAFYLKPKVEFDFRWAYYQLLTQDINGMDSGSAIPSTSRQDFYALPVRLPPLPEQRAIAAILGVLDDKIELNRRTNRTLEAMARALFKKWFVDEAEEGWEVKPISELATIVGGTTPGTKEPAFWEDGVYHWATPKDLSALASPVLLDTERKITEAGLAQIGSGLLPAGTVLLSSRAPIGYLAIAEIPIAINQGFIAMLPTGRVSNLFLLLWAEYAHAEIMSRANGSTFLEISKSNFRPIPVIVPDEATSRKFDDIAEPLYRRIVGNEKHSRTLAAVRDALLPKLMSGEVRVKGAEFIT